MLQRCSACDAQHCASVPRITLPAAPVRELSSDFVETENRASEVGYGSSDKTARAVGRLRKIILKPYQLFFVEAVANQLCDSQ
jgi:hypothetical protein